MQKILHITAQKREPNVKHHSQADDLWARFKVPEWGVFCHTERLRDHPARLNLVLSDSASKFTLTVPSNLFAQNYHLYSFLFCHFVCANVIGIDVYNFEFTERKPNPEKVSIIVAS